MKKLLFTFFTFLLFYNCVLGQANKYHPFADSNAVWNQPYYYNYNGSMSVIYCSRICYIDGDTLISSVLYHKIYMDSYCNPSYACNVDTTTYLHEYTMALRQDTSLKKVFYVRNGYPQQPEQLFYNFNLQIGDTVGYGYVSSIDSIFIGTEYRKQFHLNDLHYHASNYVNIIEGIGSTFGLFSQDELHPPFEGGSNLSCYKENNITLYPSLGTNCSSILSIKGINEPTFKIFPNPSIDILNIEFQSLSESEIRIYDILGKVVIQQIIPKTNNITINVSNLQSGIYLIKMGNSIQKVSKQ